MTAPSYVALAASGELERRARAAWGSLGACRLCPRTCGVDRHAGEVGACNMGAEPVVASWNVHFGEEPPISGTCGSGTVFFSGCTGRCLFCQNYPISQLGLGRRVTVQRLAGMMLELQRRGCHNVNLVTPTHFVPAILRATAVAARDGLRVPLVYNSSGYESVETLRLLDGVVDVYLPDAKYARDDVAHELSGFPRYVEVNRAAIVEMVRQVGAGLALDDDGIACGGVAVRHMVLPEGLSQTPEVLAWIAEALGPTADVSLMAQYFPAHRAVGHPALGRKVSDEEWDAALAALDAAGLENGWVQEPFADTDHEEVAGWERARHSSE